MSEGAHTHLYTQYNAVASTTRRSTGCHAKDTRHTQAAKHAQSTEEQKTSTTRCVPHRSWQPSTHRCSNILAAQRLGCLQELKQARNLGLLWYRTGAQQGCDMLINCSVSQQPV